MYNFVLNVIPSPEDSRDWIYSEKVNTNLYRSLLPTTLDLRPFLTPIRNQGSIGACVAFSASCIKEYQEKKQINYNFSFQENP